MNWQLSSSEIHLLRAALCSGETAFSAWQAWRAIIDFEQIDVASYRLLPLLWRNLQENQIETALMPRLQGVYRRTWVENQLLFNAVDIASQLDLVWLGEVALAKRLHGEWGVRSIAHVTVGGSNVTRRKLKKIVEAAGWRRHFSPRQLRHQLTRQMAIYRLADRYTLRVVTFDGTADAAAQLTFILRDPGSYRPNNRLVFLADVFHLAQQLPTHALPDYADYAIVRYVNQLTDRVNAET